ncbi:MAG: DUF2460 domain-containing protein [Pseudomonadota bacterium]
MPTEHSFHEVRFPTDLAFGATGGPQRRTEVVTMGSGREQRNARWAHSRRRYNAGYGIKTIGDLQVVIEFFEERRGRLFGFRFRDPLDWKSSVADIAIAATDQLIGAGDGNTREFQLVKRTGTAETGYVRTILKPISHSVIVSIDEVQLEPSSYVVEPTSGVLTINTPQPPQGGQQIRAGFEFDIPVRFDTDEIIINLSQFEAGDIPSIPIVELLP